MSVGLSLSGGSIKGAFQAGALLYLQERGLLSDVKVSAGTSVGALNSFALSFLSAKELVDIYLSLKKRSDVFSPSWYRTKGLYSTEPINKLMASAVKGKKRKFESVAVCVNLSTGEQKYSRSSKDPDHILYVKSSAVIPFFMEPVKDMPDWFDGGVFEHTPARWVRDFLAPEDKHFVITTRPIDKVKPYKLGFPRAFSALVATADRRMQDEIFKNDLTYCKAFDVPVIAPSDFIDVGTFEINPDKIKKMIHDGYEAAVRYLK